MGLRKNLTSKSCKIRIGLTIGDPSGIGPIIALKALNILKDVADFTLIGDKWVLDQLSASSYQPSTIKIIDLRNVPRKNFYFGKVRPEYGKASVEYLDKALELIDSKDIDCLVTCPISKEAVGLAGYRFFGHTEYLAERVKINNFLMLLLNRYFKFGLLTTHIPMNDVARAINRKLIKNKILLINSSLKRFFSIKRPRLVICGLNPHASDNGLIGKEETEIITPALKEIKKQYKINIEGPISSDVAILKAKHKLYDCVIAMYHDQALIPLKLTDSSSGVNLTLGLPFIRTSPLHGTAFDIARDPSGADPTSLIAAIMVALKCATEQKKV